MLIVTGGQPLVIADLLTRRKRYWRHRATLRVALAGDRGYRGEQRRETLGEQPLLDFGDLPGRVEVCDKPLVGLYFGDVLRADQMSTRLGNIPNLHAMGTK